MNPEGPPPGGANFYRYGTPEVTGGQRVDQRVLAFRDESLAPNQPAHDAPRAEIRYRVAVSVEQAADQNPAQEGDAGLVFFIDDDGFHAAGRRLAAGRSSLDLDHGIICALHVTAQVSPFAQGIARRLCYLSGL